MHRICWALGAAAMLLSTAAFEPPAPVTSSHSGTLLIASAAEGQCFVDPCDHDAKEPAVVVTLNRPVELAPGRYVVHLLGNFDTVTVSPDTRTVLRTGLLHVDGTGWYAVYCSTVGLASTREIPCASGSAGKDQALLPGTYWVELGSRKEVTIRVGERTTVSAGALEVTAPGIWPHQYVPPPDRAERPDPPLADDESSLAQDAYALYAFNYGTRPDEPLSVGALNEAVPLLPGAYYVRLGVTRRIDVKAHAKVVLAAGALIVKGKSGGIYGITAPGMRSVLRWGRFNEPVALLPATYDICTRSGGERVSVAAGTTVAVAAPASPQEHKLRRG